MSIDNEMDPGELLAHLPELTQVEEMIIARSHVQMMVHRYRGHQYHYTGHCVSFMQNTVKTVDVLPNLPSELDVVVLRPSDQVMQDINASSGLISESVRGALLLGYGS